MSIRNQPCPRRDVGRGRWRHGGGHVKINTQPKKKDRPELSLQGSSGQLECTLSRARMLRSVAEVSRGRLPTSATAAVCLCSVHFRVKYSARPRPVATL